MSRKTDTYDTPAVDGTGAASATASSPTVAVIGPLPPPVHGHMIFTERLLDSRILTERFHIVHVDISDHRGFETIGRFDLTNVVLACSHFLQLARVLVGERPALVQVPLSSEKLLGLGRDLGFVALCLLGRSKVVAQVHGGALGPAIASAPRWFAAVAGALLRRCTAFVVMTKSQADQIGPAVPSDRVVVIPHGTPPWTTAAKVRKGGPLRALYVSSHLHESKGFQPLIDAAVRAQHEGITESWEIVGAAGPDAARITSRGGADHVPGIHFRGALGRDELAAAYAQADVFVFPTGPTEGFGLVRIEAMAAGLPVITTDAGGGREIVRHGTDGYIVSGDSAIEIVDRLRELRDDPNRLAEMGANAQTRQRAVFGTEAFETRIAALWDRLAARD